MSGGLASREKSPIEAGSDTTVDGKRGSPELEGRTAEPADAEVAEVFSARKAERLGVDFDCRPVGTGLPLLYDTV
ncbi:hypothetical protein LTR28_006477 [Elasticomyces elasticus]|nr:hypothetical protein LTR28_006477 [Elasticomyces elasticus]